MTATRTPSPLIGKCRNGHVVRGENRMGVVVATTPGATVSGNCWFHCPCGKAAMVKYMTVTVAEERACNGICMGATGPSCSCSCGGENHGAARVYT
jgi:hypothetical protein